MWCNHPSFSFGTNFAHGLSFLPSPFGTDVTCSPNVLASSLGMMEHAVCVFWVYPGGIVKPNPYIAIYSVLKLSTNLRVGVQFGLN